MAKALTGTWITREGEAHGGPGHLDGMQGRDRIIEERKVEVDSSSDGETVCLFLGLRSGKEQARGGHT